MCDMYEVLDAWEAAEEGRRAGEAVREGAGESDIALPPEFVVAVAPCWFDAVGEAKEEGRVIDKLERNERDGRRRGTWVVWPD